MALRLEIEKVTLVLALEAAIKAQQRIKTTTKQPQFIPIVEKEIQLLQHAINSITEIKEK